jgi:hypothetical protein
LLKIYKATYDGKKWTNVKELPFNNDNYSCAHPALSVDEKELYFDLSTFNYSIQYLKAEKNNWKNTFGINGMHFPISHKECFVKAPSKLSGLLMVHKRKLRIGFLTITC